jgi:hypothetical protein
VWGGFVWLLIGRCVVRGVVCSGCVRGGKCVADGAAVTGVLGTKSFL